MTAVTDRQGRTEGLRSDGIAVREGNPADPSTYPDEVDLVVAGGGQSSQRNLDAARATRDRYPDAPFVVYPGDDADPSVRADIYDLIDEVIDSRRVVMGRIPDAVSTPYIERLNWLMWVLRSVDDRFVIAVYDNPNPDATTTVLTFQAITEWAGADADVRCFGDISRQGNRTLVSLLELDLRVLDEVSADDEYASFTLVDHSRPGVNNRLPPETIIDIVINHHSPRVSAEAVYTDLRRGVGATSTLLAEYLERLDTVSDTTVVTALLFGIQADTNDLTRKVSAADLKVATFPASYTNVDLPERVKTSSPTSETTETFVHVIPNRDVWRNVLATNIGDIRERDTLAQVADHLLGIESAEVIVVYGLMDGAAYVSGRTHGMRVGLSEASREALGSVGNAGGYIDMAGVQILFGVLDNVDDDSWELLATIITDIAAGRVSKTSEHMTPAPSLDADVAFEYPLDEWAPIRFCRRRPHQVGDDYQSDR